jgi:hypothetical protein
LLSLKKGSDRSEKTVVVKYLVKSLAKAVISQGSEQLRQ